MRVILLPRHVHCIHMLYFIKYCDMTNESRYSEVRIDVHC
jgi:hypothetical protein